MPQQTYNLLPAPFVTSVEQTAIAIAYTNPALIADAVLPRVEVDAPSFVYSKFNQKDMFTVPADGIKIGRKGSVPEVDFSATETSAVTQDYGLDEVVPRRDQMAKKRIDPIMIATEQVTDLVALAREIRAANTVFNSATYASANVTALSGTAKWSDKTNSDPAAAIWAAMDSMLMRPNQLVVGHLIDTALRSHPKIVQAYNGTNGQFGSVPTNFLQEYLQLDEYLVGRAVANGANKGQTSSLGRIWGNYAALLYKKPVTVDTTQMTFGITAQWGSKVAGTYFDEKKGLYGSDVVRSGESVAEVILANDLGYLFTGVI